MMGIRWCVGIVQKLGCLWWGWIWWWYRDDEKKKGEIAAGRGGGTGNLGIWEGEKCQITWWEVLSCFGWQLHCPWIGWGSTGLEEDQERWIRWHPSEWFFLFSLDIAFAMLQNRVCGSGALGWVLCMCVDEVQCRLKFETICLQIVSICPNCILSSV